MNKFLITPYFLDRYHAALVDLARPGWEINHGGLDDTAADIQHRILPYTHSLANWAAETAASGHIPISLAGDCCASLPILAGLQRAGIAPRLLWLDAHGDFNTWETTPSNFLGGMPLAMMVGRGEQTWLDALQMAPLPETAVTLADGRDLDPGEQELVAQSAVRHIPHTADLLAEPAADAPLWVHFDVDILRLEDVPAVSYPAPGGPSQQELRDLFIHLRHTSQIAAVSLSLWNPNLPGADHSRDVVLDLLTDLIG